MSRDDRLTHLLDRYFDDAATTAESEELGDLLRDDASARRSFWRAAELQVLLRAAMELTGSPGPAPGASAPPSPAEPGLPAQSPVLGLLDVLPKGVDWRTHPGRFFAVAAALTLVSWVGFYIFFLPPGAQDEREVVNGPVETLPPPVARLRQVVDAEWGGQGMAPAAGVQLRQGRVLELKSGLAEIRFESGANVVLEGPAKFTLDDRNAGDLELGKLAARVPEEAKGFSVKTPQATITDLGTEFGVEVGRHGSTETHVFQGKVEIQLADGGNRHVVTAGQAARVDSSGRLTVNEKGVDEQHFVRDDQFRALVAAARFTRFEDFEGLRPDLLDKQNGWNSSPRRTGCVRVVTTGEGTNRALRYRGLSTGGRRGFNKHLGAAAIGSTDTATMFLRVRASGPQQETHFGLCEVDRPKYVSDLPVALSVSGEEDSIRFRAGSTPLATLEPGIWYHVWVVIDRAADTCDVYVRGGAFASQTHVGNSVPLRNRTAGGLDFFCGRSTAAPASAHTYLDDIHFSPGENLADPLGQSP